ncbi:class I SAM-dependent methyltransferase [Mycobacterium sp. 236(2023)]|uniref:class I SAM-dependent methyltransferase n=1 Tax=Mycobacterium sp. 236(2023) TaxID=3038163 RepID=UPI002414D286|nr:class I SAM-dependent methyltransferase [Mycobacterium sp. 236(2023)]MDG4667826.1 class I SAM-dependent methyltransferase [Mycobacterium sp. 236(2023)]
MAEYWNHNTGYHPWLRRIAAQHRGDVLDVGCGDGLLAERLAPVSRSVTGIDADPAAMHRARARLSTTTNVSLAEDTFDAYDAGDARFDLITFVATIHHMGLRAALHKARELLRPSGEIAIVGLSANKTAADWVWAALCLPAVRIGSRLHDETPDIGVVMTDPREDLREIRSVAGDVIPGADVRRGLYYRYLLRWRRTVG